MTIMDLFRPYLPLRARLETFMSADSTATAVFAASLNQLKRLTLTYHATYPSPRYTILWHVGLLYVANAVLRDFHEHDWRFYFDLCVHAYKDLFVCYRVAAGFLESILYIAISRSLISTEEAQAIHAELLAAGAHHAVGKEFRSTHIVDLDLAVTDKSAAQMTAITLQLHDADRGELKLIDLAVA